MAPYTSGHIPWGDLSEVSPKPWIFEGSILSAEDFKSKQDEIRIRRLLRASDNARVMAAPAQIARPEPARSPEPPTSVFPAANSSREALVFEQEITLQNDGQSKQWSLQVPASTMNPEMVDMMLELHDLNSYFIKSPDVGGERVGIRDKFVPPTLMLSNSTLAIPISLDSSPSLTSETPLAVRRGKKVPPTLNLNEEPNDMPYPSIPTAFLGSPSTYSPKFEYANHGDEPSMNLDDMVANLRSRCSSLSSHIFPAARIYKGEESCHSSRISMASFSEEPRDNEWAFADDLMNSYSDKSFLDDFTKSAMFSGADLEIGSSGEFETDTSVSAVDTASPAATDTPLRAPSSPHSTKAQPPRPCPQEFLKSTPPPVIPPPLRPAISLRKPVRGILKSVKSVRFASLPDDDIPPRISILPSITLGGSLACRQSKQASSPSLNISTDSILAKGTSAPLPVRAPSTRRASESSAVRPTTQRPSIILSNTPKNKDQSAMPLPGRHSMGAKLGKENRPRSSSTTVNPSRFVLDEKSLKRVKGMNAKDSGSQKSRMPIAVRNIFTRFK